MNGQLVEARQTDTNWLGRLMLQHPALVGTRITTDNATLPTVVLDTQVKYGTVQHSHALGSKSSTNS